ncbi:hypothetical protein Lal_00025015 [Lupinus albus]|uniref:Putative 1,4-alpha-glucan-branching enzyme, GlgB n=1 Tax=Lupinus albus TaxID=3870 RepID=A0A6A4PW38_LUPAL|nr:putative 1,4-alpha-glucan-branching enzyme, GlgB [Lupinus albus]KAF1889687.1 hypothetical protein Lal_00025015 [Lupinus albus]
MHTHTQASSFMFHLTPSLFFSVFISTTRFRNPVHRFSSLSLGSSPRKRNSLKVLCKRRKKKKNREEVDSSFLEEEILEFMQNSNNPNVFPTREELVAAGRVDLVEAIVKEGGWFTLGWDLNEGVSQEIEDLNEGYREIKDFEDGIGNEIDGNNATWAYGDNSLSSLDNSSQQDRSAEIEAGQSGIEGILNRLENERNNSFGLEFREKEDSMPSENNVDKDQWDHRTTMAAVDAVLENSSRLSTMSPTSNHSSDGQIKLDQHRSELGSDDFRNSHKAEGWRTWIVRRTGFTNADFEDAEIAPSETQKGGVSDVSGQLDLLKIREFSDEPTIRETGFGSLNRNANHNDIKSRILNLESELSSVLHSLRSSSNKVTSQTDQKGSSGDLSELSDAWEFQENEIINAQDRLRTIRAKLAVLEGKMTLAIMDAQKIVEEKQKRINDAHRALQLLKTTSVVWPNTASEVLLVGSFDGWSTQRKMDKSSTGIFSVCLQLYPGKYEIKFIVDGEWKIDPMLPIVDNNGHVNNLLVVYD